MAHESTSRSKQLQAILSYHGIQGHVMCLRLDPRTPLALEGDSDQERGAARPKAEAQPAVVVTGTVAESIAGVIEADQRHQHYRQRGRGDGPASDWLADQVPVAAQGAAVIGVELHLKIPGVGNER
jgi:hypothetical protein